MSVSLSTARAKCLYCAYTASQISTTQEHAIEVVTAALERHMAEKHGSALLEDEGDATNG